MSWAGGLAAGVQFGWSGVGGRELQGPRALGYLVGVVFLVAAGRRRDRSCGVW